MLLVQIKLCVDILTMATAGLKKSVNFFIQKKSVINRNVGITDVIKDIINHVGF